MVHTTGEKLNPRQINPCEILKTSKPSPVKAVGGLGILLITFFHKTSLIMWTLILILFVIFIIATLSGKSEQTGHWSHLFADMQHDPEKFYELVEEKLKEREVPDFKTARKTFREGGLMSHNRIYLEVSRGDYIFHICAAPWGKGFFFSSWTRTKLRSTVFEKLPIIGKVIAEANQYDTYYKLDTDGMFRSSVHQTVLSAIDNLTEAKGIKGLTELERKPDLRSLIK